MEHYSVHLDQYISLTSSSSGNFLTPWNIFSAAVLLTIHGVQPKQIPGSSASGPSRVGAAAMPAPALLGRGADVRWDCSKDRWANLGAKLHKQPAPWDCPASLARSLSQRRGPSLYPSAVRNRPQSSCFRLFAV